MLLSSVPISALGSEDRMLTFVGFGAMALLAQLTQAAFALGTSAAPAWKRYAQVGVIILLPLHLIASPRLGVARMEYQENASARMLHAI
jgi:hypothetical protein